MKSRPIAAGQAILASQNNDRRDDARGGSFLLVHQQLGSLTLPTNPSNGNTTTFAVNGTNIVINWVSAIGSTPNNVLIGASASASVNNLVNFLRRPDLTTSTQVAASGANQTLLQYVGWAYPGSATSITPFSLNKNVNGNTDVLTSFTITTTVSSGTWTPQTMQLYIEDGAYYIGTTRVLYSGGSTPTFTAPVSNPRIDLITADSSGTIALVTGTESATPSAPSYPANKAVLAEVYHVVAETGIFDFENQQSGEGYISNDVRPTLLIPYISSPSQVASGLFIPDPGSEAQGDVLYYNGSAWTLLTPGTSGYVLTTKGASANPQWGNASPSNIGFIAPGTNITPAANQSVQTIASVANIPALTTNQTMLVRFKAHMTSTISGDAVFLGMQQGSNSFATVSGTGTNGLWTVYYDAWIIATTPASAQTVFGYSAVNTTTPSFLATTAAANFGSTWTLNFVGQESSHNASGTWVIDFCSLYIFN